MIFVNVKCLCLLPFLQNKQTNPAFLNKCSQESIFQHDLFLYSSVGEDPDFSKKGVIVKVVLPIIAILVGAILVGLAYWKKKLCFKSKLNMH